MTKLIAVAGLALGVVASTPARADFAVVQFQDLPDWLAASAAFDSARSQGICR